MAERVILRGSAEPLLRMEMVVIWRTPLLAVPGLLETPTLVVSVYPLTVIAVLLTRELPTTVWEKAPDSTVSMTAAWVEAARDRMAAAASVATVFMGDLSLGVRW